MNTFIEALMSQSFVQNISLLLVTAALTGLLVPTIKASIDNRDSQRQKRFEDALDRQKKLRDYQAKLLDDLDELLWEYQALALEPTYYKMRENEKGYAEAFQQYDQKAPTLLQRIRAQVSKVRRFADPNIYQKCRELSYGHLKHVDTWLVELDEKDKSQDGDWADLHYYCFEEVGKEIDEVLHLLASDFDFIKKKELE